MQANGERPTSSMNECSAIRFRRFRTSELSRRDAAGAAAGAAAAALGRAPGRAAAAALVFGTRRRRRRVPLLAAARPCANHVGFSILRLRWLPPSKQVHTLTEATPAHRRRRKAGQRRPSSAPACFSACRPGWGQHAAVGTAVCTARLRTHLQRLLKQPLVLLLILVINCIKPPPLRWPVVIAVLQTTSSCC